MPRSGRCAAASGRSAGRPRSPCGGSPLTAPGLRLQAGFLGVHTHLSTAAIPLAPAQKPPALPPVPFGGSHGLFTRARPLPAGMAERGGIDAECAATLRPLASGRADRLSRKASCVPVRASGGPGFPLRRPSFFSQGELVASPTETSRASSPLVFPERACRSPLAASRGYSSSPSPPEQTDPVSSSVYSSYYKFQDSLRKWEGLHAGRRWPWGKCVC